MAFLFCSLWRRIESCAAHTGYVGTDRCLVSRNDTLLLQQIARDLFHVFLHRIEKSWHGLCCTRQHHWLNCEHGQSEQNRAGTNHRSPDHQQHWHMCTSIQPPPNSVMLSNNYPYVSVIRPRQKKIKKYILWSMHIFSLLVSY